MISLSAIADIVTDRTFALQPQWSCHYSVTPLLHYSMISIWELANPQLREITVYQPGKPIEETARELGLDPGAIIKLASNENPLGPSPMAMEAMREALEKGHLYPD